MGNDKQAASATPPDPGASAGVVAIFPSQQLLQGRREVVIHHAGEDYRLRITRLNKLILTK